MTSSAEQAPKQLGNRPFGFIFAGIFTVIALWPVAFGGDPRQWALIIVALFAVPAVLYPRVLQPLNDLWVKFGMFMHMIINPILMGIIFFVAVVPTGLILKLLGKDPMRRKLEAQSNTYWLPREDGMFDREKFKNQF